MNAQPTAEHPGSPSRVESAIATRERSSTVTRVGRLFVKQLHGRSTLVIVLLVALVLGVALAIIRNGTTGT